MNTLNLSESEQDEYRERAAILEFEAGYNRPDAERVALEMVLEKRPKTPVQIDLLGSGHSVLAIKDRK